MMPPVSVCHHVSTMGQRSAPICLRYQIHASGLMGSPTVPITRKLERSCFAGQSSPHLMNVRIAVGAQQHVPHLRDRADHAGIDACELDVGKSAGPQRAGLARGDGGL